MALAAVNEMDAGFERFLEQNLQRELLRFTTAGSVDDGKSTLIGRLLHDAQGVYEDQLASVRKSRINRSTGALDFSLITDGLRAEREQGITIDVGYRYFATPRRKFIIADTPGHEQYTRNMATGASTADAAVILLDATKGVLPQTKRHAYIAALLGIRHIVAIVNKMDLADYREDVFEELEREFAVLAARLGVAEVRCIPVSAVEGDNVVHRSKRTPWYGGPTMLEHLENVPLRDVSSESGLRLPIQYVIRPDARFRGFAGRIASGVLRSGEAVLALPSQQIAHVKRIASFDGDLSEASEGMSVTVQLEEEIDLSRGDILVSRSELPAASKSFSAAIVWLHPKPMEPGREYLLKHTGKHVKARITRVRHRINVNTLNEESASDLKMNEIALAEFSANQTLFFDAYRKNRATGSFILIDPLTNATVGAGMIREDLPSRDEATRSFERRRAEVLDGAVSRADRTARHGHRPAIVSLAGGGAERLERVLFNAGFQVFAVDRVEILPQERAAVVKTLLDAGFLVIFSNSEGVGELREYCAVAKVDMIESSAEEEYSELQLAEILARAELLRRSTENDEGVLRRLVTKESE